MDAFRAFLIDHEYDLAIQILEELSEEYPDDPYLPGYLGMRYYNHYQDYDEASRHFQEALDRESTFVPAYHLLGAAALNQQDYSAAEAYFREGVRLAPDEWRPYYALGLLFAR